MPAKSERIPHAAAKTAEETQRDANTRAAKLKIVDTMPTLSELAALVVGGKTEGDRLVIYREFLHHFLRTEKSRSNLNTNFDDTPETTPEEVFDRIERERREGFDKTTYTMTALNFRRWKEKRDKKVARDKASNAAKKRYDEK